jgi:hypothetical protein
MLRIEHAPGAITQLAGSDLAAACELARSKIGMLLLAIRVRLLREAIQRGRNQAGSENEQNLGLSHNNLSPFLVTEQRLPTHFLCLA